MSDFLGRLARRALDTGAGVRPRLPSLFEPTPAGAPASAPLEGATTEEPTNLTIQPDLGPRHTSHTLDGLQAGDALQAHDVGQTRAEVLEAVRDSLQAREALRGASPFEYDTQTPEHNLRPRTGAVSPRDYDAQAASDVYDTQQASDASLPPTTASAASREAADSAQSRRALTQPPAPNAKGASGKNSPVMDSAGDLSPKRSEKRTPRRASAAVRLTSNTEPASETHAPDVRDSSSNVHARVSADEVAEGLRPTADSSSSRTSADVDAAAGKTTKPASVHDRGAHEGRAQDFLDRLAGRELEGVRSSLVSRASTHGDKDRAGLNADVRAAADEPGGADSHAEISSGQTRAGARTSSAGEEVRGSIGEGALESLGKSLRGTADVWTEGLRGSHGDLSRDEQTTSDTPSTRRYASEQDAAAPDDASAEAAREHVASILAKATGEPSVNQVIQNSPRSTRAPRANVRAQAGRDPAARERGASPQLETGRGEQATTEARAARERVLRAAASRETGSHDLADSESEISEAAAPEVTSTETLTRADATHGAATREGLKREAVAREAATREATVLKNVGRAARLKSQSARESLNDTRRPAEGQSSATAESIQARGVAADSESGGRRAHANEGAAEASRQQAEAVRADVRRAAEQQRVVEQQHVVEQQKRRAAGRSGDTVTQHEERAATQQLNQTVVESKRVAANESRRAATALSKRAAEHFGQAAEQSEQQQAAARSERRAAEQTIRRAAEVSNRAAEASGRAAEASGRAASEVSNRVASEVSRKVSAEVSSRVAEAPSRREAELGVRREAELSRRLASELSEQRAARRGAVLSRAAQAVSPESVAAIARAAAAQAESKAGAAQAQQAESAGPPVIRVTIGRVEVRAVTTPAPQQPAPRAPRANASPSLEEYLKGRNGGRL